MPQDTGIPRTKAQQSARTEGTGEIHTTHDGLGPDSPHPAHGSEEPRHIPPHGDVSPDGRRPWPQPSPAAKWLVWGGTGLAAAALTAGTVIAARHLLGAMSGDGTSPRPSRPPRESAPRFSEAPSRKHEHSRQHSDAGKPGSGRQNAHIQAETMRKQPRQQRRPSLMQEVEYNTESLSNSINHVMHSLNMAVAGFRDVAGQASMIVREFGDAAELVRGVLNRKADKPAPRSARTPPRTDDRHGTHMPDLKDDPLGHDPMDGPDHAEKPADGNPRLHRL